jgi:hypothetical protein
MHPAGIFLLLLVLLFMIVLVCRVDRTRVLVAWANGVNRPYLRMQGKGHCANQDENLSVHRGR